MLNLPIEFQDAIDAAIYGLSLATISILIAVSVIAAVGYIFRKR